MNQNNATLLKVSNLSMRFGGLLAVDQISLEVKKQEVMAIIGPNGAGKTTVFNCISGFYRPTTGSILLGDKNIAGKPSHVIAQHGVVRTFQNIRLFKSLTVLENLLIAQHNHLNTNFFAGLFRTPAYKRSEEQAIEHAAYWLDQLELTEFANRESGTLSYGTQRRVEIARCMMTSPQLLLLDEPAAGLNPQETHALQQLIRRLCQEHHISVLLIEHDMKLIMGISDRILVMEHGKPIMTGTPEEVRHDARVIKAYLGEE